MNPHKQQSIVHYVLITGADTITGYNTARALSDVDIRIWGVTVDRESSLCISNLWDRLFLVKPDAGDMLKKLIEIGEEFQKEEGREKKLLLMISQDYVVRLVSYERKKLHPYYKFVLPEHETVELLLDKTLFQGWAEKEGYTAPLSYIVNNNEQLENVLENISYPVIVKPSERSDVWDRKNTTIKGMKLNNSSDIKPYLSGLFSVSNSYIIQEWIPGGDDQIYFCLFYFDKQGREVASFTGRKLLQWPLGNGSTSICIGVDDEDLYKFSLKVLQSAGLKGLGSLEVKYNRNNKKFYIIEPTVGRNDLQSDIAVISGLNISRIALDDLLGLKKKLHKKLKPAVWIDEHAAVRGFIKKPDILLLLKILYLLIIRKTSFAIFSIKDIRPFIKYFYTTSSGYAIRSTKVFIGYLLSLAKASKYRPGSGRRDGVSTGVEDIKLVHISEAGFFKMKSDWNELLFNSNADKLFLGWDWQSLWWKQWSNHENYQLFLLAAFSSNGELIGLAPLYKYYYRTKYNPVYFCQMKFIGSSWGVSETVRTEYLDFIMHKSHEDEVRDKFLSYLDEIKTWDQFIVSDMDKESGTYDYICNNGIFGNDYKRTVHDDRAIHVKTTTNFTEYLSGLGRNTRYRIKNRREYLFKQKDIKVEFADNDSIDEYFDVLNSFHVKRWGRPCFVDGSLAFNKHLAGVFYQNNRLVFSKISISDRPVSILYNLKAGDREYNIQAGFDETYGNKISFGILHIGLAIESAFNDENIKYFDLLAGAGKKSYYKSHFGRDETNLITLQINRSVILKYIYIIYDFMPAKIKYALMYVRNRLKKQGGYDITQP